MKSPFHFDKLASIAALVTIVENIIGETPDEMFIKVPQKWKLLDLSIFSAPNKTINPLQLY